MGINNDIDSIIKSSIKEEPTQILVEAQVEEKEIEMRSVNEVVDGEDVVNQYMVHVVQPKTDSLFKLAYLYKVSQKEI